MFGKVTKYVLRPTPSQIVEKRLEMGLGVTEAKRALIKENCTKALQKNLSVGELRAVVSVMLEELF